MPSSGLRENPKRTLRIIATIAAIIWAVVIFALSSIPSSGFPPHPNLFNIVAHFCEYAIFAVFITLALNNSKRALWKTALIAILIASLYAVSDELHQYISNIYFDSGRFGDPFDWLTDTLGAIAGAVVTIWFISSRKVSKSRKKDADKRTQG